MASLSTAQFLGDLPAPKNVGDDSGASSDAWFKREESTTVTVVRKSIKEPPGYRKRMGFVPRKIEDFGDGGAFPEIHVAQYPLDMGRKDQKATNKVLSLSVDGDGNVAYDAIVKQGENRTKTVFSQHKDLVPKIHEIGKDELKRPGEEEEQKAMEKTRAALEKIVVARISAAQPKNVPGPSEGATFIKYKPSQQGAAFNSGAKERVIRMVEAAVDPMEPPKFRHKRVPKASGSPPVPVMHSPPRPVTVKDQQDWKIPPCISNWKNAKGYTIPLDKRLAADGRGLQDVQINDNFAALSEALYAAESNARKTIDLRTKIQKELLMKEKDRKEQELRELAAAARMERSSAPGGGDRRSAIMSDIPAPPPDSSIRASGSQKGESREEREERMKREAIREERRRERERERRLEAKESAIGGAGKKSKVTRDRDRDISEKVALGMASTGATTGELMYDQRLFNQDKGMDSGFAAEDSYNLYDKALFNRDGAGGLFKVRKLTEDEMNEGAGAEDSENRLLKTERFKPDKGFAGTDGSQGAPRSKPVEFEAAEADPFGLDRFLSEVRGTKATDKVGSSGTMRASGGGSGYDGGSGRSKVDFKRGGK